MRQSGAPDLAAVSEPESASSHAPGELGPRAVSRDGGWRDMRSGGSGGTACSRPAAAAGPTAIMPKPMLNTQ